MLRRIKTIVAAAALAVGTAGPALAGYGAFATDEATGKFGLSWNEETQSRADEVAIKDCGGGSCKVRFRAGPRQCEAVATPEQGSAIGAAYRPSRDAAALAAINDCQKRTKAQCKVRTSGCNR